MYFDYNDFLMPSILIASVCIGFVMKKWLPTDDRIIPTCLGLFGIVSGFILFGFNYEGFVKGLFSGLAAVGAHQVVKQSQKELMGDDELYAMGAGIDEEVTEDAGTYELEYEEFEEDEVANEQ